MIKKIYFSFLSLAVLFFALAASCSKQYTLGPTGSTAAPTPTPYLGCLQIPNVAGINYSFYQVGTSTVTPVVTPIPTASTTATPIPYATYTPYTYTNACGGTLVHNLTEWQSFWTIQNLPIPAPPTDFSSQMIYLYPGPGYFTYGSLDALCYDKDKISIYTTTYPIYFNAKLAICFFCPVSFSAYLIPQSDLLPECYTRYWGYILY